MNKFNQGDIIFFLDKHEIKSAEIINVKYNDSILAQSLSGGYHGFSIKSYGKSFFTSLSDANIMLNHNKKTKRKHCN